MMSLDKGTSLFDKVRSLVNRNAPNHKPLQKEKQASKIAESSNLIPPAAASHPVKNISESSQRLRHIIDLMNEGRNYRPLTVAKLADILGLSKIGDLEKCLNGKEEPTFKFLNHFASTFGVNIQWLKYGEDEPYENTEHKIYSSDSIHKRIDAVNPTVILFVRSKSDVGEAQIVLQLQEWHYQVVPSFWHISSYVGYGGAMQMLELYKLISVLRGERRSCSGFLLPPEQFQKLHEGKVFPGSVLRGQASTWWDDFTDAYHRYPISQHYERNFGEEFVRAQEILREYLDREDREKREKQ